MLDVIFSPQGLNSFGFVANNGPNGLALNTFGFLYPLSGIWDEILPTLVTNWTLADPVISTSWLDCEPVVSTIWAEVDPSTP